MRRPGIEPGSQEWDTTTPTALRSDAVLIVNLTAHETLLAVARDNPTLLV